MSQRSKKDCPSDSVARPFAYTEYPVRPPLAEFVLCGWSFIADECFQGSYIHHVLPDGCMSLVYRAASQSRPGDLIVTGPRIKELRVEINAGDQYWGIKFRPDAGGIVIDIQPSDLREQSGLLATLAPHLAQPLSDQLAMCREASAALDVFLAFVEARLYTCTPIDDAVRKCVFEINRCDGELRIGMIADLLGISHRQLQRRFRAKIGLTPKEYSRIRRMRIALANTIESRPKGWGEVAANAGYADQSHLSRETAALTGLTPASFKVRIQPIVHLNVDP
jgi:AraC-like DNA-binding protein